MGKRTYSYIKHRKDLSEEQKRELIAEKEREHEYYNKNRWAKRLDKMNVYEMKRRPFVEQQINALNSYQKKKYIDRINHLNNRGFIVTQLPSPAKLDSAMRSIESFDNMVSYAKENGVMNPNLKAITQFASVPAHVTQAIENKDFVRKERAKFGSDYLTEKSNDKRDFRKKSLNEQVNTVIDNKIDEFQNKDSEAQFREVNDIQFDVLLQIEKLIFGVSSQTTLARAYLKERITAQRYDNEDWYEVMRAIKNGAILFQSTNFSSSGDGVYNTAQKEAFEAMDRFVQMGRIRRNKKQE